MAGAISRKRMIERFAGKYHVNLRFCVTGGETVALLQKRAGVSECLSGYRHHGSVDVMTCCKIRTIALHLYSI